MTVSLVVNGTTFFYPETGDTNWGPDATDWASAVTSGMLQKAGGLFILLAEVDFGATYGLKSAYFLSRTTTAATAGSVRLAKTDVVSWRDNANAANLDLGINASDLLTFNGATIGNIESVTDTNSINLTLTGTALSADLKLSSTGADASNQLVSLIIETDGLRAQILDSAIFSALPNADTSTTGLLTSTDWNTFNGKQAAGSYITALTGDVTASGPGSVAATIANAAVSLAKMANLAANSIIGNNTGSPATPIALTTAQATAMLDAMVGDSGSGGTKGLVPAPTTGDSLKFLCGSGSFTLVPLTTGVTGTLGIGNGGTGQTTANAAFNALSPLTTKGDLIGFSTVNARLAIGTDAYVLTADTASTLGFKWAPIPGVTAPDSMIRVDTDDGYGSTSTMVRKFTNVTSTTGSAITLTQSSTLGWYFTINVAGVYAISYTQTLQAQGVIGIALNASGTTAIDSLSVANRLNSAHTPNQTAATRAGFVGWTGLLAVNDVITAQGDGTAGGGTGLGQFTITQVTIL